MFYCEQGEWNESTGYYERETFFGEKERTPFLSVLHTFWWIIVTMTTVGYGDMYPTSLEGRILGSLILIMSIIWFAIPIALVGVAIDKAFVEYTADIHKRQRAAEIKEIAISSDVPSIEFYETLIKSMDSYTEALDTIRNLCEFHTWHLQDDEDLGDLAVDRTDRTTKRFHKNTLSGALKLLARVELPKKGAELINLILTLGG
ncbi:hypothetical protein AAMO2058_000255900 [Amorphochlora amoebiformis]